MDDPIKWLRKQVDEDERVARAAARGASGRWRSTAEPSDATAGVEYGEGPNDWPVDSDNGMVVYDEGAPKAGQADHIARHDPARVLREVEAKRRIIDVAGRWRHYACPDGYYSCSQATEENGFELDEACADGDRAGQPCDCGLKQRQLAILGPLALPYADRPGYREEWRP